MDIKKIVFTGGPCAGKTTLIEKTKEYLEKNGYDVIVVPEAATIILKSGINLKLLESITDLQEFILKFQLFNERLALEAAEKKGSKKFAILFDRGVFDNKAYFDDSKKFDKILAKSQVSEINYLDSYDLVFDLITTADCAPEKYTLANNSQRTESPEEAKSLDKKTSNAWAGHRNIKIINSDISLDEATKIITKEIDNLYKNKTAKELKVFDLNNTLEDFNNYNDNNSRLIKTQKMVLNKENEDIKYAIYKRTYKNENSYLLKVYKEIDGVKIVYYDEKIPFNYYLDLITKYKIKEVEYYKELFFIENRQEYKIKFYDNKTTLEYEENKLNKEFILPECIKLNKNKNLEKKKKRDNID